MNTVAAAVPKPSFKAQMLLAREEAIVATVNRLLAEKGFEAMTVDEVAASVGIAKASLYKHFPSKEDLAAAAMVRIMQRALDFLDAVPAADSPIAKLRAVARWTMEVQLAGEMPSLPHQSSSLRATLMANRDYIDRLVTVSDTLGGWIVAAQKDGSLSARLPAIAILYTLYARACDPVLEFLKGSGQYSDAQIVEMVLATCFDGLAAR
ncbi:MAG: TetR/AcrR family transcriptional regulator [Variovorax sp.]|nr:MAG: TetR/AcrR family transcriptional regulator [Variovorax sp.]